MSFFALIFAIVIEWARPLGLRSLPKPYVERAADFAASRLYPKIGEQGQWVWFLVVVPPVLLAFFLHVLLVELGGVWGTLLDGLVTVLVFALSTGFSDEVRAFSGIRDALKAGDVPKAQQILKTWANVDESEGRTAEEVERLTAENAVLSAHRNVFAPVFWFLVLPGASGIVFYRLAFFLAKYWGANEAVGESLGSFSRHLYALIDTIPARLLGWVFAVVGNFEDARYCRSTQASTWPDLQEGILLSSVGGALGIHLGGLIHTSGQYIARSDLGMGGAVDDHALQRLSALILRAFFLLMLVMMLTEIVL